MQKLRNLFFLLLILILIPYALTNGHGTGESFEVIEGEYLVDVGYDASIIEEQTPIRFEFSLFANKSKLPTDFDNIWVRVEETGAQKRTIFATGIHQPTFGPTSMLFSFPKEATYMMYARFQNADDEKIVEVTVPVPVEKSSSGNSSFSIGWSLFLALFIGLASGMFIPNPFKKSLDLRLKNGV